VRATVELVLPFPLFFDPATERERRARRPNTGL
jgi:hypothetical protein